MSDSPLLLSVVVPTRERAETLPFTLATALDQTTRRFEVVVSDNFSQDGTRAIVERLRDARVKYVNPGRRLSMTDHWEFALEHAAGRYVLFIGDDDAILPGAIDRLEPLLASTASRILTWEPLVYCWPMDGHDAVAARLPPPHSPVEIDIRRLARFSMRMGTWRHYGPPSIYHSAFHRSVLDELHRRTGRVFHTTMLDIFSGFAAAAVTTHALSVGFPVSVSGRSRKSNSGRTAAGRTAAVDAWAEHLGEYDGDGHDLHRTLYPDVPIRVNMIAHAVLVAKELFPEAYSNVPFGYPEMWAYLLRTRRFYGWDASLLQIVGQRKRIRRYHPLSVSRLLAASALHRLIELTGPLRLRRSAIRFRPKVPPDIAKFAKAVASLSVAHGR